MREKEDFRATLEQINQLYPTKQLLNISEVAKITGLSRDIVRSSFSSNFVTIGKSKYINKSTLARLIS